MATPHAVRATARGLLAAACPARCAPRATAAAVAALRAAGRPGVGAALRPLATSHAPTNHDRQPGATPRPSGSGRTAWTLCAGAGVLSLVAVALAQPGDPGDREDDGDREENAGGGASGPSDAGDRPGDPRDPSLPRFRLAEVRRHDARSGAPWVTSGDRVYDITDWVAAHPGGDVILRAAGHSIDPYWAIFSIHQQPHVREILDSYLIGLVDAADLAAAGSSPDDDAVEDPFAGDPVRDPRLCVHTAKPCNAEPPAAWLARDFVTPAPLFYVRNHMWVPPVPDDDDDPDNNSLLVELPDGATRAYALAELRDPARFRRRRVTAALQCSGNRRSDMARAVAPTDGLPWAAGAISNAVWEGVFLRDVLADAGLSTTNPGQDLHVQMTGREAYGASIPLPVALDPRADVLLAFAMNGGPLPPDHGAPLRAVVPGHVAARSVKWLARIAVADEESPAQWQRRDYKLFGPNEGVAAATSAGARADPWTRYPAIQEMPVTSAITAVWVGPRAIRAAGHAAWAARPGLGRRAPPGVRDPAVWQRAVAQNAAAAASCPVALAGYAYAGGGREIVRVDVSLDGGRTWDQAELLDQKRRPTDDDHDDDGGGDEPPGAAIVARGRPDWAWKRWRYAGLLLGGGGSTTAPAELVVKATDSAYNTQPAHHDAIYNVRGNLATAWHRVVVEPVPGGHDDDDVRVRIRGCGFEK